VNGRRRRPRDCTISPRSAKTAENDGVVPAAPFPMATRVTDGHMAACLAALACGCATGSRVPSEADGAPAAAIDAALAQDGAIQADGPVPSDAQSPPDAGPYRRAVTIDGLNDFDPAGEAIATTSPGFVAHFTWDDQFLYIGYAGVDVGSGDPRRWLHVYLDVDPGDGTGAAVGERYNTQQPGFPSGFGAEYYFRWKASNDFQSLEAFDGEGWEAVAAVEIETFQSGTFVESSLPLDALGSPERLGIVSFMLNETPFAEGVFGGLYPGSFADGYQDADVAPFPIEFYLEADFSSSLVPSAPERRRPL
jgi:hypothetical protein